MINRAGLAVFTISGILTTVLLAGSDRIKSCLMELFDCEMHSNLIYSRVR